MDPSPEPPRSGHSARNDSAIDLTTGSGTDLTTDSEAALVVLRRLAELEMENRRLQGLVAELILKNQKLRCTQMEWAP